MSHKMPALSQFIHAYPWRSALFVLLVVLSFVFDVFWIWGFFWIGWAITSVMAGEVVFLDVVGRRQHPVLFWIMILCWTLLGVSYLAAEFYPQLFGV